MTYCPKERTTCVEWVDKYFKDCLCNFNDEMSFGFGIISLICWGVAEIPQIVTNFNNKSSSGVSLAFLSTWIIGDVFNLVGCSLEPATLPTQFYTALLYTSTTIVLVIQCIYYDHFLRWRKGRHVTSIQVEEDIKHFKPNLPDSHGPAPNAPLEVPRRREFYFMSARSLAGSDTSPHHSYIKARSGPSALEHADTDSSSDDEAIPTSSHRNYVNHSSQIRHSAGYGTFLAASFTLSLQSKALTISNPRLSQEHGFHENVFGQWLGWLMAAIYMGGRIPQIWLNIKRGTVEGLNPLMFIFALTANATYVASILVRSTEWEKTRANLPWLLDAIVCVALDLFIILQYIYYRYGHIIQRKIQNREEGYEDSGSYKTIVS